jgi:hypothetical protein
MRPAVTPDLPIHRKSPLPRTLHLSSESIGKWHWLTQDKALLCHDFVMKEIS